MGVQPLSRLTAVYTIKRAAELTGISPDTLRMWERRYGVVAPARSDGNYRLYDDGALRTLSAMAAMVSSGWSPSQAADQLKSRQEDVEGVSAPARTARIGDPEALARVAVNFDIPAMTRALDEAFALGPVEEVVDGWMIPALQELGRAWQEGRVTVAEEHFVSSGVQRRLASIFDSTPAVAGGPRVLVGLGPGSRHELGILAFAIIARRAGLDVVYLGPDVPTESWLGSVRADLPAAVVLSVPTPEDVAGVRDVVETLRAHEPSVPVYLGGGQQGRVLEHVTHLGHEILPAVEELTSLMPVA